MKGELASNPRLAVLGDYNIAPEDRDVHDPKAWEGQVLVSPPEREAFRRLIERFGSDIAIVVNFAMVLPFLAALFMVRVRERDAPLRVE